MLKYSDKCEIVKEQQDLYLDNHIRNSVVAKPLKVAKPITNSSLRAAGKRANEILQYVLENDKLPVSR